MKVKSFVRKNRITIFGVVLGSIGGYAYYLFYGCQNGCPIWANPWRSVAYGAIFGGLLLNLLQDFLHKRKK